MSAGTESEELRALTFVRRSLLRKNDRIRDLNQKLNALQEENDKLKWKCSDQDKEIERLNNELSIAAQGSHEEAFVSSQESHPDKNNDEELHTDFDTDQENDMCGESSSADIFPYKDIAMKREFSENHTDGFHHGNGQHNDFNTTSSTEDQHQEHSVASNTNNMQMDPHADLTAASLLGQIPSENDGAKATNISEMSVVGVDHLGMAATALEYGVAGAPGSAKRARLKSRMSNSGPYSGVQGAKAERKFACKECGARYKSWGSLTRHRNNHVEARFSCQYCGKAFHRKDVFIKHMQMMHAQKAWQPSEAPPPEVPPLANAGAAHREAVNPKM